MSRSDMAQIAKFERVSSTSSPHPTETEAEWTTLTHDGTTLLQISTFGSSSRASHRKVSQTLQFNASMAAKLRQAIDAAFGDRGDS